ncbi:MAG: glycosyltransferase, partial [Saprospiraceae bacterium]
AKGTIISFIDDDAIAQPTFLQNLHNFFSKHPNAVGVGGKVTPIYEKQEPAWMCRHLVGLVSKVDEGDIVKKYTHNKPYPIGCNMSYTKTALQAVGGFNEKLAWRGDDKYIFRAIKKYSNNIFYVPDVAVGHHIDAFRLTDKNVLKLCERIGSEEGLRVKAEGMRATIFTFIDFIYKAIGSFALAAYYYVKGKPAAAKLVIQYRWLALRGLLLSVF